MQAQGLPELHPPSAKVQASPGAGLSGVYFHGFKLHLLVDDGLFVHEVALTPGSVHDMSSSFLLPLEVEEGKALYMDRGYESYVWEEVMPIRKWRSRRYVPWLQYLALLGRRVVETVGSRLLSVQPSGCPEGNLPHTLFPRRIHAVRQEGFVLKVLTFVLAHDIRLIAEKIA
jgi:hypothetical protein